MAEEWGCLKSDIAKRLREFEDTEGEGSWIQEIVWMLFVNVPIIPEYSSTEYEHMSLKSSCITF